MFGFTDFVVIKTAAVIHTFNMPGKMKAQWATAVVVKSISLGNY
jgi:hypothetical protein